MAIRIKFDSSNNARKPTLILATRSGRKLGAIPASGISGKDAMNDGSELRFTVNKEMDGVKYHLWDQVKDFRLVYCREWDTWFEINVEISETNETIKNVSAKSLGESELSQIKLHGVEINTESDIDREDYIPTVLYNEENPSASLLHRILDKAPHYRIDHVDLSIKNIQRSFQFDDVSIYDAFQQVAEEINCIFIIGSGSDSDGNIDRKISVYDLESFCLDCGKRNDFTDKCPECGSENILPGYGEDTSVFVSADNLAEGITYSTDIGSVKNCFRLVAGDDLMTATIANCNPNGSGYIWYISDEAKEDMSSELASKIEEYDAKYDYYQKEHKAILSGEILTQYNALIEKYSAYSDKLKKIPESIVGYPELMNTYYDTIDFNLFLKSGLMPGVEIQDTTAEDEVRNLVANITSVAMQVLPTSVATASSAVLSFAKSIVDPRYHVKVIEGVLDGTSWTGSFIVTRYSDEKDTATSDKITVLITDDYEEFVRQTLDKTLSQNSDDEYDASSIFNLDEEGFSEEISKYSLTRLTSFYDSCQGCLDVLIEKGISNQDLWEGQSSNLYEDIYLAYYNKLNILSEEIKLRESEIDIITGHYDKDGVLVQDGLQTLIEKERTQIQSALNFEAYLGDELWLEFVAYRREDTYQNDNYISDGLDNTQLFRNALEFIDVARKEIIKSATLQHSISATMKNLLVMKEFASIVDHFEVGNWIRVKVDNSVYRLRLIDYEINFDELDNISVNFSDVKSCASGISDIESILNQAASMSSSYESVARQAGQGQKSSERLDDWFEKGMATTQIKLINNADNQTQSWDSHGMLFKQYNAASDTYDNEQMKIINSTLSITDDNWESVKTAVGAYYYFHPKTGKLTKAYGVNAETLVGKVILGEQLGIYNSSGGLSFDDDGFVISNDINSFTVNPNSDTLLSISNKGEDVFYVDTAGTLHIRGDGSGLDISSTDSVKGLSTSLTAVEDRIDSEVKRLDKDIDGVETTISSRITQTADDIKLEISKTFDGAEIVSRIEQSAEEIKLSASKIQLEGIVTANENFMILEDGSLKAKDAIISGNIIATSGTIGGWNADGNALFSGETFETSDCFMCIGSPIGNEISIGGSDLISGWMLKAGNNFGVTNDGSLYASDANISGNITATSGKIGGCIIDEENGLQISAANIADKLTADKIDVDTLTVKSTQITGDLTANSIIVKNESGSTTLFSAGNNAVQIAGWNVDDNSINYGNLGAGNSMWLCRTGTNNSPASYGKNGIAGTSATKNGWCIAIGNNFGVDKSGSLYAYGAEITGKITATGGSFNGTVTAEDGQIGDWIIEDEYITSTKDVNIHVGAATSVWSQKTYLRPSGIRVVLTYKSGNPVPNITTMETEIGWHQLVGLDAATAFAE